MYMYDKSSPPHHMILNWMMMMMKLMMMMMMIIDMQMINIRRTTVMKRLILFLSKDPTCNRAVSDVFFIRTGQQIILNYDA